MNATQFMNWLPELLEGLKVTIGASLVCIVTAVIWGCIVASMISLNNPVLSAVLRVYTSVFRNSPLLVWMFLFFYGLPFVGITLSAVACGILAITLNEGACRNSARGNSKCSKRRNRGGIQFGTKPISGCDQNYFSLSSSGICPHDYRSGVHRNQRYKPVFHDYDP